MTATVIGSRTGIPDMAAAQALVDAAAASAARADLDAALAAGGVPDNVTLTNTNDVDVPFFNQVAPVDGSAVGDFTYLSTKETRSSGFVKKIEGFGKNGGGTGYVKRFTLSGTASTKQGTDYPFTIPAGAFTKTAAAGDFDIPFAAGEKLAVRAFLVNGKLAITNAAGSDTTPYRLCVGDWNGGAVPSVTTANRLEVRITVQYANGDAEELIGSSAMVRADRDRSGGQVRAANYASPLAAAPTSPGTVTAGDFIVDPRPLRAGRLAEVEAYADTAGFGLFAIVVPTDNGWQPVRMVGLTFPIAGTKVFTAGDGLPHDFYVPQGGCRAWYRPASGGAGIGVYTASNTNGLLGFGYYLKSTSPPVVGVPMPLTFVNTAQQLNIAVKVESVNTPRGRRSKKAVQVDTRFAGGVQPGNLISVGGWTFTAGKATSGAAGIGNYLKTTLYSTAQRNTGRAIFKAVTGATVVALFRDAAQKSNAGSLISIDFAANTWNMHAKYSGAAASAVYQAQAAPFTNALSTARFYKAEMKKRDAVITVTLWDVQSGEKSQMSFDTSAGGVTDVFQDGIGFGIGAWSICATAGQVEVYDMYSSTDLFNVRLLILDDSTGRPNQATFASCWTKRVFDDLNGEVLISAIDGSNAGNLLVRLQHEVEQHDFDYVIWHTGANKDNTGDDADSLVQWKSRMAQAQRVCDDRGIEMILAYVSPDATIGATLQAGYTAHIDAQPNRGKIGFHWALTVGHDGVTQDATMFAADARHPNTLYGQPACYDRVQLDVGHLLSR